MRKIRILFTGVNNFKTFVEVLEQVQELGEPQAHSFKYKDAGHGEIVLLTLCSNKEIEQFLETKIPNTITGVEEIREEERHDYQTL